MLNIAQIEIFKLLLEHMIKEKIENATTMNFDGEFLFTFAVSVQILVVKLSKPQGISTKNCLCGQVAEPDRLMSGAATRHHVNVGGLPKFICGRGA